jgi:hypothetical protein
MNRKGGNKSLCTLRALREKESLQKVPCKERQDRKEG